MKKNYEKNIENSIKYVEIDGSGKPVKIVGFCKASDQKKDYKKALQKKDYEYYYDVDFCKELGVRRID